ncbi:MAG TPA: 4'-phosphopantetheinyl transferase superfamily protein [Candidatus Acidoferrum sp.]|nr:4'-phosphopantetheinyl transferase superfamily protein [Candidatus Acidoferrum sp.]
MRSLPLLSAILPFPVIETIGSDARSLPEVYGVRMWSCELDRGANEVEEFESLLSSEEIRRARSFRFLGDRNRFVVAHGFVRRVLSAVTGVECRDLEYAYEAEGKPRLRDRQIEFSLSHSDDLAVLAVSRSVRVGVDVEKLLSIEELNFVASKYLPKNDFYAICQAPARERSQLFLRFWTRRESLIKAAGLSLATHSSGSTISMDHGGSQGTPFAFAGSKWLTVSFRPADGYVGAVTIEDVGVIVPHEGE